MITIIVPVFNVEKYLVRCIESILDQTYKDFELILVDDGSTDKSGEICDNFSNIDKRIKVIHKENGGLSSARNVGLDIAKGDYIGFIDSDDFIDKDMYLLLFRNIEKYDVDIAMCKYLKIYNHGNRELKSKEPVKVEIISNIEALNKLYTQEGEQYVVVCNKLYKRSVFDNYRFELGRIYEDEFIIHKLFYKSKKICIIDKILYYYFQRSGSIMYQKFSIKNFDAVDAFYDRMEFFKVNNETELYKKAETYYICKLLSCYKKQLIISRYEKQLLKAEKRKFIKVLLSCFKNPYNNWKSKMLWIIFGIQPKLYFKITSRR